MTSSEDAEVLETQLTLHFGATLAVTTSATGFQDWLKPAASFSHKWRGEPTAEQLILATKNTQDRVLAPLLEEIIAITQNRLIAARRGG